MINLSEVIIQEARVGNTEVINEAIHQKANVNATDEKGYTPLIIACYNNRYEAVKLLLESGADVNAQDPGGYTALMGLSVFDLAAQKDNEKGTAILDNIKID